MRFGSIDMNPVNNPAVLDTASWDEASAAGHLLGLDEAEVSGLDDAIVQRRPLSAPAKLMLYAGSFATRNGSAFALAGLPDGQRIFLEVGSGPAGIADRPLATVPLAAGRILRAYRTDAPVIDRYCQQLRPDKAPRALGTTPRLGIGVRMSAAMWPAIYRAMASAGFAANSIQNSVRELELLENILSGRPPQLIYYPGFGGVQTGHTGATFEGLWTYGVLAALESEGVFRYGADADHIKVSPGDNDFAWAKHVLDCARYYSFYTLDVADELDYGALWVDSASAAESFLTSHLRDRERSGILAYHREGRRIGGYSYRPDEATLGRLVGKYWSALAAAETLTEHIRDLRGGRAFDLEFAVDERPPQVGGCESITRDQELAFILLEACRRDLPFTHVAPNFGVEKGVDYRCPGGQQELEWRIRRQHQMAEDCGMMLDFHSADDLSQATRQVIGRATRGCNHFKIAPEPQLLFAATARDLLPELFREWWEDARAYAESEAQAGSHFAAGCLKACVELDEPPGVTDPVFHNFGFGFVGKRDTEGQYLNRERLFSLPPAFYREYEARLERYLCGLAQDLFNPEEGQTSEAPPRG